MIYGSFCWNETKIGKIVFAENPMRRYKLTLLNCSVLLYVYSTLAKFSALSNPCFIVHPSAYSVFLSNTIVGNVMKLTIKQEDMIDLIDVCWSSFFCELESWRGSVIVSNCVDTTHAPILDDDLRRTAARPHFQAWVTRKKVAWVWNCETVAFF